MNDLQRVQLDILKEFDKVCRKHNLKYFLTGGNLIGAVRHKGFIPWDDDIDVEMPRPDYDKLLSLKDEFKHPYFLQTYQTDPRFPYNYMKIRNSNTTYIENFFSRNKMNHGVWIDVFPLDGVSKYEVDKPTFKMKAKIWFIWLRFYLIYLTTLRRPIRKTTFLSDIFFNLIYLLTFWLNINHFMNKWIDRSMKKIKYDEAKMICNLFSVYHSKSILSKEYYKEAIYLQYEDGMFLAPINYHQMLTKTYGDYMKLPPIEKQICHHYHSGFSLTIPYTEFDQESYLKLKKQKKKSC